MASIIMNFNDGTDMNAACSQVRKLYPSVRFARTDIDFDTLIEEAEDKYLLELVMERKKNDNGVRWTFEEILAEDGLTLQDLENMEDVELEYELPG